MLNWLDQRTGFVTCVKNTFNWSVPQGCLIKYLPCGIVFAFLLQAITGVVLWMFYSTNAQSAWESVFYVQYIVPGGWLLRGIHHYSAQVLVFLLGAYLFWMILHGVYRSPREFVFWTAILLFFCALGACLTGDLLSWSISGYSATQVRVNFLNLLPYNIGDWLIKLAIGGPGPAFGTLTITRFLVLHILICGGGFAVLAFLWMYFEQKALSGGQASCLHLGSQASSLHCGQDARAPRICCLTKKELQIVPFFGSWEIVKCSIVCFLVMLSILLLIYQNPILNKMDTNAPPQMSLGAKMFAPADPANPYDAARPEWSFRALYELSNLEYDKQSVFPGDKKYIPIFVITGALTLFFFLIPIIGKIRIGHYFNVLVTLLIFGAFCYLTFLSYKKDIDNPAFQADVAKAELLYKRSVELALGSQQAIPDGEWDWNTKFSPPILEQPSIAPGGVLSMLQKDAKTQGPILYSLHCASCHPFSPPDGTLPLADFDPIPCETPSAPNLYNPITKEWISGFFDAKKINSDDYFGGTKFKNGSMSDYVKETLKDILADEEEGNQWLQTIIEMLHSEAKLTGPRTENFPQEQLDLFEADFFNCTECHAFYSKTKQKKASVDLRGYMSREWLGGIIANAESPQFYGKENDRMPIFYKNEDDKVLTKEQISLLADWLHGIWFRPR